MTRFSTFSASSATDSMGSVLAKLERCESLVGAFLLGSTAGESAPWSDYDLLLVPESGEVFEMLMRATLEPPHDYLTSHGWRWLGDKDALQLLRNLDPEFTSAIFELSRIESIEDRLDRYQDLFAHATRPIGDCWSPQQRPGGWFRSVGTPTERSRWEAMLSEAGAAAS